MKYIFVDFEMCMVPKNAGPKEMPFEIIQFGAVELDDTLTCVSEFSRFVKPQYGELTPQIISLTGIKPRMLEKQPSFIKVFSDFISWIGEDEDYIIYSWSDNDLVQMKKETKAKHFPKSMLKIFDRWVDFQKIFTKAAGLTHVPSLSNALEMMQVEFVGSKHMADADAYNTARLFVMSVALKDFGVTRLPGEEKSDLEEEGETAAAESAADAVIDEEAAEKIKKMLGL